VTATLPDLLATWPRQPTSPTHPASVAGRGSTHPTTTSPPRRSSPATRPLRTCAAPARRPSSPAALTLPAACARPHHRGVWAGRDYDLPTTKGKATTTTPEPPSTAAPRPAGRQGTNPHPTVPATTDTLRRARLRTHNPRYVLPHPRAASRRQGSSVMPDSRPPEKYGVPRGLECPTCGRFGRLEMRNDAIRWAVGHQDGCAVLLSSRPVPR